jgi:hypothetical protein
MGFVLFCMNPFPVPDNRLKRLALFMADGPDFIGENIDEPFCRDDLFGFGMNVLERVFELVRVRFSKCGFDKGCNDSGDGGKINDIGVNIKN